MKELWFVNDPLEENICLTLSATDLWTHRRKEQEGGGYDLLTR